MAVAALLAFPALGKAPSPKRKPYADVERWAYQVNDGPWLHFRETITKWGLRRFLVLVQTCLHPGVPATKCCAQIIV